MMLSWVIFLIDVCIYQVMTAWKAIVNLPKETAQTEVPDKIEAPVAEPELKPDDEKILPVGSSTSLDETENEMAMDEEQEGVVIVPAATVEDVVEEMNGADEGGIIAGDNEQQDDDKAMDTTS